MITRAEYMANSSLHDAYHQEIAEDLGIEITDPALIEQCRRALASGDVHLRTIPLQMWDGMALGFESCMRKEHRDKLRARGDFWSLGIGVCLFKAAARKACKEVA
jgi:hypothetical protein